MNSLISRAVWWYPNADKGVGPRAATVTGPAKEHRDGLLSLLIWEEGALRPEYQRNVHHMADPKLETHPRMKEQGAWEAIPGTRLSSPNIPLTRKQTD